MKKTNLSFLAFSIALAPLFASAQTVVFGDTDNGTISIGGNVEFNINFRDHETPKSADANAQNEIDQDGRRLPEFAGEKSLNNGYYVGFKGQSLLNTSGTVSVDDVSNDVSERNGYILKPLQDVCLSENYLA